MADGPTPDEPLDDGSEPQPFNPFAAFPMFGDLAKALQSQGPLNWDAARQFAMLGATQGEPEANVDPTVRIAFTSLAQIAALHVNDVTGVTTQFPEPRIVTRSEWAAETLTDYRPLFTDLATSLGQQNADAGDSSDAMMQMMAGLSRMMGPAMTGMSVGSMVGHLSQRVFGLHDLPIPRERQQVMLIAKSIDDFATSWEIPLDQMRLWVLAHELSGYFVFSISHLRDALTAMVRRHVSGFQPDASAITDQLGGLGGIDPFGGGESGDPMEAIQKAFSDPAVLLGAVQSADQRELQPYLDAAAAHGLPTPPIPLQLRPRLAHYAVSYMSPLLSKLNQGFTERSPN